jgi:hypothetical protein
LARGDWGRRSHSLAETALDSWYVKSNGIVGLLLHIGTLRWSSMAPVFAPSGDCRPRLRLNCGLLCGWLALLCASYGNQVFGQTSSMTFTSMVFFWRWVLT